MTIFVIFANVGDKHPPVARPPITIRHGNRPFCQPLALTKAGLTERDRLVFHLCRQAGLPVAITLAGGYGKQIEETVDIYFQTIQIAQEVSEQ